MNLNLTVNEASCGTSPSTPGAFNVRVKYTGAVDDGHVTGPFGTRESAESAAIAALSRSDVQSATIETGA